VGVAAARGLALATGKPVVAATSLAVMAHLAEEMLGEPLGSRRLTVGVDAGRGAHYVQTFTAGAAETGQARLLTAEEAAHSVGRHSTIVVGSGAPAIADLVLRAGGDAEPRFPDLQPHARNLALMADRLAVAAHLKPLYLRAPDAKPQDTAPLARMPPRTRP
jgi:tRNA threonylcarbamoyladenosine biosynthesis protein TsaB